MGFIARIQILCVIYLGDGTLHQVWKIDGGISLSVRMLVYIRYYLI